MTRLLNAYFDLDAKDSHRVLSYLDAENIEYDNITSTVYIVENITEEQYTDIRLRFNISTSHVVTSITDD